MRKPFAYRGRDPLYPGDNVEIQVSSKNASKEPPQWGYFNGTWDLYFYKCSKDDGKLKLSFYSSWSDMTFEDYCIDLLLEKGVEVDESQMLCMLGPSGNLLEEW